MKTAYSRTVTRRAMTTRYELLAGEDGYGIRVSGIGGEAVLPALAMESAARRCCLPLPWTGRRYFPC